MGSTRICALGCSYYHSMNMSHINLAPPPPNAQQRLLEGWLLLPTEVNQLYGSGLEPAALGVLILWAAPALARRRTALEARLSLWVAYQQHHTRKDV